jgi:dihydroorotase-like cyclic amidohydrolase
VIDLLIRGGDVVKPDGSSAIASVLIDGGRITEVIPGRAAGVAAREVLDVGGLPVLPGVIDTHFHVGFHSAERDYETETRAAVLGGVTTVCRYYRHLGSYDGTLDADIQLGEQTSYADFAIHLGLLTEEQLAAVPRWIADYGIRSFKMYTCYKDDEGLALGIRGEDDGFLLAALATLATAGDVVANVHCENQEIIDRAIAMERAHPGTGNDLERWSAARPPIAEAEAIQRVALLARHAGAELFIPHVSSDLALEAIHGARTRGGLIWAETCPHYLALDTNADAGVLAKINPPIRPHDQASHLWSALADGRVQVVGSDHGTTLRDEKHDGDPVGSAPGFQGVGTILPILLDRGVGHGRLALADLARMQAAAAAIFRLPGKGRIEAGADADLVVVDLQCEKRVDAAMLGGASDFSVFEGSTLKGWPVITLLRGQIVARDGVVVAEPGTGRYLRR